VLKAGAFSSVKARGMERRFQAGIRFFGKFPQLLGEVIGRYLALQAT